jgi:hypothetical protein
MIIAPAQVSLAGGVAPASTTTHNNADKNELKTHARARRDLNGKNGNVRI